MIKKFILCGVLALSMTGILKAQSLEDAVKAMDIEQYQKSKNILRTLIANTPENPELYYYLGENYFRTSEDDSAAFYFKKGTEINAASPYCFVGLGEVNLLNKDTTSARANFEKAAAMNKGKDFKTYLLIGQAYTRSEESRNLAAATTYLAKAKTLEPKNADLYLALGDVALEQNNGTEAAKNYEQSLTLNGKNPRPFVRQGQIYKRALNFEVSLDYFNKALAIDPNYPPAFRELGELYFKANKFDKAIESYKRYVESTDNSINTQVRYASFLFLNKDYKEAISVINQVLEKDTTKLVVYRLLGYSAYETKDYPRALQGMNTFFQKAEAKRLIPSDYAYLGKSQIKNKMDSLGIMNIRKGMDLDTNNLDLYNDLADAYYQAKRFAESAATYEIKKAKKGLNAAEYFNWGRSLYFAKEYVKADSAFSRVNQIKPFATAFLYRGRINVALDTDNKQGLAKPFYDKVIEMQSADPVKNKKDLVEAYSYLGDYFFQQKDNVQSKASWQKVLEIDPENKQAIEVLKQLK